MDKICAKYTQRQWKVTSIYFNILENIEYSSMATFTLCFWSATDGFGEIKQYHEPWNYDSRDARAFYVFRSFFKNLKSSFS